MGTLILKFFDLFPRGGRRHALWLFYAIYVLDYTIHPIIHTSRVLEISLYLDPEGDVPKEERITHAFTCLMMAVAIKGGYMDVEEDEFAKRDRETEEKIRKGDTNA